MSCGQTKAEAVLTNVLAPYSLELIVNDLSKIIHSSVFHYMLQIKKNIKLFPVVVSYFQPAARVVTCLLDFIEDSDETAVAISDKFVDVVQEKGLNMQMVCADSAENASVNFGKHRLRTRNYVQQMRHFTCWMPCSHTS